MKGWIKLDRQLQDNWVWQEKPFSKGQAWVDLLMLANYEDKKTLYKGEVITCKRGDVNLSISYLASRWGWSRKYVTSFLGALENDNMVATKVATHRTVITIVNYDVYQVPDRPLGSNQSNSQGSNKGSSKGSTTKNNKKDKNNIYKLTQFTQGQKREYSHEFFEELEGSEL